MTYAHPRSPVTSKLVAALLVTVVAGSCAAARSGGAQESALPTLPDPPRPVVTCAPSAAFCNVAADAGLQDVPRYGRGVSFADVDRDGDDDVFIADTDERTHVPYGVSSIYLNRGDGTFERADLGLEEGDLFATWGGAFGDYDNDGYPDLLITNGGFSRSSTVALYHNDLASSGKFTRVTDSSGIAKTLREDVWWGGSWADYDLDGWADFVVVPLGGPIRLFHNQRDGTFSDVTERFELTSTHLVGKNPVWFDMENDGDPDLYIPDNGIVHDATKLYENRVRQGGGFVDVTAERIGAVWPDRPGGVFAASAADFNQDGYNDLYLGRWTWQDLVLVNDGRGYFRAYGRDVGIDTEVKYESPLEVPGNWLCDRSESENTMGLGVSSIDGDLPMVFVGTGNPKCAFDDVVFCTVLDATHPAGFRLQRCSTDFVAGQGKTRAHGVATADVDSDGDTDVVWANGGHPDEHKEGEPFVDTREWISLFENRGRSTTATVVAEGTRSGRDAFGARIRSESAGVVRYDTVRCQGGFVSQNSRSVLVRADPTTGAEVTVFWPAGGATRVHVQAGTVVYVSEDGSVRSAPRFAAGRGG